jgi:cytochrome c oxidase assembly protein Cox11
LEISLRPRVLTVVGFVAVLAVMTTVTSYSVTLYRLFCQATGANGTTQRSAQASSAQTSRVVTVFFDTSTAPGLPWVFEPAQRSVRVHLGEDALAFFTAANRSGHDMVGHATFNVTPEKVGLYFRKIQCFCFNEERLAAGQTVQMPVTFFVDPRMADDPDTRDVNEITLSYTFFESRRPGDAIDLARFSASGPDAKSGAALFAARCAACHALDHAVAGPPLGTVVGRETGVVAGYPYSAGLQRAHLIWTPELLDRWLANPQATIPGAQMPMRVENAADRRDLIAYLAALPRPRS